MKNNQAISNCKNCGNCTKKEKEQLELDIAVAISKLMLDFQKENNVKIEYLNLYFDEQSGKSFVGSVNIEI